MPDDSDSILPDVKEASRIMGREPFNPIGTCFDATAHQAIFGPEPPKDLKVCHGIGYANMPGQEGLRIGHAWIEYTVKGKKLALDMIWGVDTCAKKYRADLKLEHVVEYPRDEFFTRWVVTDYPGPWDKKILEVTERARKNREDAGDGDRKD